MRGLAIFVGRIAASVVAGWFLGAIIGIALWPESNLGPLLVIPPAILALYTLSFVVVPADWWRRRRGGN